MSVQHSHINGWGDGDAPIPLMGHALPTHPLSGFYTPPKPMRELELGHLPVATVGLEAYQFPTPKGRRMPLESTTYSMAYLVLPGRSGRATILARVVGSVSGVPSAPRSPPFDNCIAWWTFRSRSSNQARALGTPLRRSRTPQERRRGSGKARGRPTNQNRS